MTAAFEVKNGRAEYRTAKIAHERPPEKGNQ
jgi:hypothetical protein